MKEQYIVTVDRPDGVSVADMKAYISDALNSWWGQFCPPNCDEDYPDGDPRWGLQFTEILRLHKGRAHELN